jgi:hypothetical protein
MSLSERFPSSYFIVRSIPKLFIRNRYYILFLILVFIVQVTKLVQFTYSNTFSKNPPSTSLHVETRARTWRVTHLSASWPFFMRAITAIALSREPFGIGHKNIYINFAWNGRYYDLPEYWSFLLGHSVFIVYIHTCKDILAFSRKNCVPNLPSLTFFKSSKMWPFLFSVSWLIHWNTTPTQPPHISHWVLFHHNLHFLWRQI